MRHPVVPFGDLRWSGVRDRRQASSPEAVLGFSFQTTPLQIVELIFKHEFHACLSLSFPLCVNDVNWHKVEIGDEQQRQKEWRGREELGKEGEDRERRNGERLTPAA